jgi:leucyl-tRNA synthetase
VEHREGVPFRAATGGKLLAEVGKMSKSRFNTVSPDDIIDRFGADTERVYTLFIAPPEKEAAWSDEGVIGAYRFLNRVWVLGEQIMALDSEGAGDDSSRMTRKAHQTIAGVTRKLERFEFNTAISSLMELSNAISDYLSAGGRSRKAATEAYDSLLRLLHPFAPHVTEELWEMFGNRTMLLTSAWPIADAELMKEDVVTVVVQVNGKLRAQMELPAGVDEATAVGEARRHPKIIPYTEGKAIAKTIYVPGKLVNLVVR